jgi:AcrR family transcriptional regulator
MIYLIKKSIKKKGVRELSPRSKQQYSQLKDERREQILFAALKLFAKRGLAATKISEIAATANLSHGLVYHYFESKEKIYIELVTHAMEQSAMEVDKIEDMPIKPLEKIQLIYESIVQNLYQSEDSAYYFLLIVQALVSDANPVEVKEKLQMAFDPMKVMMKIVEEGQKNGSIQEGNAYDYVMLFWAAVAGLAPFKISIGDDFKVPNFELFLKMLPK